MEEIKKGTIVEAGDYNSNKLVLGRYIEKSEGFDSHWVGIEFNEVVDYPSETECFNFVKVVNQVNDKDTIENHLPVNVKLGDTVRFFDDRFPEYIFDDMLHGIIATKDHPNVFKYMDSQGDTWDNCQIVPEKKKYVLNKKELLFVLIKEGYLPDEKTGNFISERYPTLDFTKEMFKYCGKEPDTGEFEWKDSWLIER